MRNGDGVVRILNPPNYRSHNPNHNHVLHHPDGVFFGNLPVSCANGTVGKGCTAGNGLDQMSRMQYSDADRRNRVYAVRMFAECRHKRCRQLSKGL